MTACTEEFEKALGKLHNECTEELSSSLTPILTDIARYWFESGFIAGANLEREACAKVCDALSESHGYVSDQDDGAQFSEGYKSAGALECAVEIRAPSNAGIHRAAEGRPVE